MALLTLLSCSGAISATAFSEALKVSVSVIDARPSGELIKVDYRISNGGTSSVCVDEPNPTGPAWRVSVNRVSDNARLWPVIVEEFFFGDDPAMERKRQFEIPAGETKTLVGYGPFPREGVFRGEDGTKPELYSGGTKEKLSVKITETFYDCHFKNEITALRARNYVYVESAAFSVPR
ncbi:hypothetical protein [Albibacillus kandeliae]|uniref:hypothetical protein n=1 Tax=Albibacillus kandeliae TaxID=2174228 RepID=UPI0013004500|nr:hypothetical protein [Albibacillus kandeliae]